MWNLPRVRPSFEICKKMIQKQEAIEEFVSIEADNLVWAFHLELLWTIQKNFNTYFEVNVATKS